MRALVIVLGAMVTVCGWWLWAKTNDSAHLCSDALVHALVTRQCDTVTLWHAVGIGAIAGGIIIFLAGLFGRRHGNVNHL